MSEESASEEKPYDPTPKRLEDARLKGNIPRSTDLNTAVAYGGVVLAASVWGGAMLLGFGGGLAAFLSAPLWNAVDLRGGGSLAVLGGPLRSAVASILPLFLIPMVLVLLCIAAQQGFVFHGGNLEPKVSRISILENVKKKFGRRGLFEFFKSFLKLVLYSALLIAFIHFREPDIIQSAMLEHRAIIQLLGELGIGFFLVTFGIAVTLGLADIVFQRAEHIRSLRMTHKELMDEVKNSEGDPAMKQKRRQRGMDIARVQMLTDVKDADVIVVNPEHYAVALKWSRAPGSAPTCVAKGVDELAATIRRLATENDVPIYREPPTARALYATVEIGDEIPTDFYGPVAAAIRFAEDMRQKTKKRPYGTDRPVS